MITGKWLYNDSRVYLCKKDYAKNGPNVRKIRRFAEVARWASFDILLRG